MIEVITRPCAWCLKEQGKAAGEGSHGICKNHAKQILLDYYLHKYDIVLSIGEIQTILFAWEKD